jgi:hypothetical protein
MKRALLALCLFVLAIACEGLATTDADGMILVHGGGYAASAVDSGPDTGSDAGQDSGPDSSDAGPTIFDAGPASKFNPGGQVNIEVNFTSTVDSVAYGVNTYVWSVSPGLNLYINASTGDVVLDANGSTYTFDGASGWRAGAQVDFWISGGNGVALNQQYRTTYIPNTNGYFESGIAISVSNFAAGVPAAIDAGAVVDMIAGSYVDGTGSIGTVRGVNLNTPDGGSQPTWVVNYPITTGSVTHNLITIGDSLETGYLSGVSGFPVYASQNLGSAWSLANEAVAGQQTSTMLAGIGAQTYANMTPNIRNVVTFEGGINDLINGRTAAQIWTTYQEFSTCVKAYAVGTYSAWTSGHSYAAGAMASVSGTLYQTILGGTSGSLAPSGTTVDATVSDQGDAGAGVTWFVTGPTSQNTGSVFSNVILGVQTPPITWGSDTSLQPGLATLSVSILAGVPTYYDFVMQDLQHSDVMNNNAQVPWRIFDLVHPSESAVVRQGFLAAYFLKAY